MPKASELLSHFADFPLTSFWRLFIDRNRQEVGPQGFDIKEPGYLKSLQHGFDYAISNLGNPLTADFLTQLHDSCVEYTYHTYSFTDKTIEGSKSSGIGYMEFDKGIRDSGIDFELVYKHLSQNFSLDGLHEFLEKIASDKNFELTIRTPKYEHISTKILPAVISDSLVQELFEKLKNLSPPNSSHIQIFLADPLKIKQEITRYIQQYQEMILKADNDEKKLHAIANLVHELELIHPFNDGNCRTFTLALLPKLMIEQGFPPVILENPNRFDLFSINELVVELQNGINNFNSYKNKIDSPMPDHFSDTLYYLNNTTALLLVNQGASKCDNWSKINSSEQKKAIKMLQESLMNLTYKELNFNQVQLIGQEITALLTNAIHEKSAYPISLFNQKSNNNFAIHFENIVSRIFQQSSALSIKHITSKINDALTEQLSPKPV